jgi:26S proteasome regulatory subunit N3
MGKEIDMNEADASKQDTKPVETEPTPSIKDRLCSNVKLIEKAVRQKETRSIYGKALRQTQAVRKDMTVQDIKEFLQAVLPTDSDAMLSLQPYLQASSDMMLDAPSPSQIGTSTTTSPPEPSSLVPEVDCYCHIVVLMHLLDSHKPLDAASLSSAALIRMSALNRRTLDNLNARLASYYSLSHERIGQLAQIRPTLLALHRTATLRRDEVGQETLLNLLLRDYLHHGLYDQAEALRTKAQRPDPPRSPQQHARYLFYQGRIAAVMLDYSDARDCLAQAVRRAPATSARGFRLTATKWLVVVRLLLGEVPDRSELTATELRGGLGPYFDLAAAVRAGDLSAFAAAAAQHDAVFKKDATYNLVVRLRHNVIRTALRRVNAAYSKISLKDIAIKVRLPSAEEAEFVVAKAIRDGGIDGTIDRSEGALISGKAVDVYATEEPAGAFHARTSFCLELHNEAVRAMRFAPKAELEWDDAAKAKERRDQELQAALEEDDMDI